MDKVVIPPKKKFKKRKADPNKKPVPPTVPQKNQGNMKRGAPTKKVKKETEEEKNVWKWWEEEKSADGRKWTFLEHKGGFVKKIKKWSLFF